MPEQPEDLTLAEGTATLTWAVASDHEVAPGERAVLLRTERSGAGIAAATIAETLEVRFHPPRAEAHASPGVARGAGAAAVAGGIVLVGGAGDGLDGPAYGLYPDVARRLQDRGVAGLRVSYRHPNHLEECVLDTLLGVEFLAERGIERAVLVGHSFGGAVVITAGAVSGGVVGVVAMSTQTHGTDMAPYVSPRPLLLVHGTRDRVLSHRASEDVHRRAKEPKELRLFEGAGHGLDEAGEEVRDLLERWVLDCLLETRRR